MQPATAMPQPKHSGKLRTHPDNAPALNNLAVVLSELGEFDAARRAAEQALALGAPWNNEAQATLLAIEKARRLAGR